MIFTCFCITKLLFPSKGKKHAQLLQHTLPLQSDAKGSERARAGRTPQIPPSCQQSQLFPCGFSQSLTPFPTPACKHPFPQPGEERHLAGSFSGFHLEKQSNGFLRLSSPARNIKAGFAHWSLQKGRMKMQVHICTFMSCHQRRAFLKKPTFVRLNSGRVAGRGSLDSPKD